MVVGEKLAKEYNKRIAGLLFFVGAVQFVLAVVISEAVYSGYSVGQQPMSDLGNWSLAGNSAAIFNVSAILLGMFGIAGAYFIQRGFKNRLFTSLLAISGIGYVGVGVVAENISLPVHVIFAIVSLVFGAASAIVSYKFEKSPISYVSVIFGAVILLATVLLLSETYLGLGLGGMQHFIIYSLLLWELGFGAYLIGESNGAIVIRKV
jgi:hypothetical membrane protein